MWDRLARTVAPAVPPVSLEEAKAHLKVTSNTDDALITALIAAATATIDGPDGLGIALVTQTWTRSIDGFPWGPIVLPLAPVQSVTSITYKDAAGVEQTLDPTTYRVSTARHPAVIFSAPGYTWPATAQGEPDAVTATFVAGYGLAAAVPADLKAAILLLVGHLFENREAVVVGAMPTEVPLGFTALTSRYRRIW